MDQRVEALGPTSLSPTHGACGLSRTAAGFLASGRASALLLGVHVSSVGSLARLPVCLFACRQVFAMFVAALGHDIDHPGVNNSFEVPAALDFTPYYCADCIDPHAALLHAVQ